MVHCSISVIGVEAVCFDFFDTLTTEFSKERTRLSSSSCSDRFLGSSLERSKRKLTTLDVFVILPWDVLEGRCEVNRSSVRGNCRFGRCATHKRSGLLGKEARRSTHSGPSRFGRYLPGRLFHSVCNSLLDRLYLAVWKLSALLPVCRRFVVVLSCWFVFIDVLNLSWWWIVQLPEPAFESPLDFCRRNSMLNAKRAKVGDG